MAKLTLPVPKQTSASKSLPRHRNCLLKSAIAKHRSIQSHWLCDYGQMALSCRYQLGIILSFGIGKVPMLRRDRSLSVIEIPFTPAWIAGAASLFHKWNLLVGTNIIALGLLWVDSVEKVADETAGALVLRFCGSFSRRSRWEATTLLSRLTLTPLTLRRDRQLACSAVAGRHVSPAF
jgi:hypothetical protein